MIFTWTLVIIFNCLGVIASRRMANLGYVLWIVAMAASFLTFCIIGDNLRCEYAIKTPKLICDINSTQLPVFLLANIFTGLTNVLIDTRAQPPLIGHLVMMIYLSAMCSVGYGIANNETIL
jgi:phosphatidylinositol glycan class W